MCCELQIFQEYVVFHVDTNAQEKHVFTGIDHTTNRVEAQHVGIAHGNLMHAHFTRPLEVPHQIFGFNYHLIRLNVFSVASNASSWNEERDCLKLMCVFLM